MVDALEAVPPGPQHLLGIVEPLLRIAAEGPAEEAGKLVAEVGVEDLGVDLGLAGHQGRIALAVAPLGQRAGRQLVERHRGGEPLGVEVPAGRLPLRQEGLQVADGARPALDLDEEETDEVSTKRSTSLMLPSSTMNSKLDQARKGSWGGSHCRTYSRASRSQGYCDSLIVVQLLLMAGSGKT